MSKALEREEAKQRAATKVNAAASSNYQPKGVPEGRAAHVTAKATDSILKPDRMLDLCGVWNGGTLGKNMAEQERPGRAKTGRMRPEG